MYVDKFVRDGVEFEVRISNEPETIAIWAFVPKGSRIKSHGELRKRISEAVLDCVETEK